MTSEESGNLLRRDWKLFTALTFLFSFGFSVYTGVFQNFLKEGMNAGPFQLGQLESLREVPGFLAALMAGTLVALAESRVAALGLFLCAIGIGLTGDMGGYWGLVAITVFWSVGFHVYAPVSSAITLALSKGIEGGRNLGRMAAVGSAATLLALGLATLTAKALPNLPYRVYFWVAGGAILAASILCMKMSTHSASTDRARLVFRKEYGLYYLLTFLEGCRRQIFSIFASFTLIFVYGVPVQNMLILMFINSVLISVTAPRMGRIIDRYGERTPLTFYAIGLIVVFAGYATIPNIYVLYALFLIDNVLFSFSMGFTTYLHRIVRPGELTPCLAMGTTMNHVAAVTVPVGGAYLWQKYHNYQIPFWVGVVIAVVALLANQWLPKGQRPAEVVA